MCLLRSDYKPRLAPHITFSSPNKQKKSLFYCPRYLMHFVSVCPPEILLYLLWAELPVWSWRELIYWLLTMSMWLFAWAKIKPGWFNQNVKNEEKTTLYQTMEMMGASHNSSKFSYFYSDLGNLSTTVKVAWKVIWCKARIKNLDSATTLHVSYMIHFISRSRYSQSCNRMWWCRDDNRPVKFTNSLASWKQVYFHRSA